MHTIDVDFDVLKTLMALRPTEEVTYNGVLRELLKLGPLKTAATVAPSVSPALDWIVKGVRFRAGTEFRSKHHGKGISANVVNGALFLNGKRYDSPSSAAVSVTGYAVNGWTFWEVRLPGSSSWRQMQTFREQE